MENPNLPAEQNERAERKFAAPTPGPWFSYNDDGGVFVNAGREIIAACGFDEVEPATANARLIAAAPDMLAALQRLVNDSMFKHHPEASQMAIDAIRKATGEA